MEIRKIQGIIISSLLIVGLTACSNSSNWNQEDNSPWKTKRGDDASEEFVELSVDEQPFAESEMIEPERESMFETEPVLSEPGMPEPIVEMPAEMGTDIMSAPASAYVVQVYAGRKLRNVNKYKSAHGLDYMQVVKTDRGGDIMYVLVSLHDGLEAAKQASFDVEQRTGSKPWIRPVSGLQRIFAN